MTGRQNGPSMEPLVPVRSPPWEVADTLPITFSLNTSPLRQDSTADESLRAARQPLYLASPRYHSALHGCGRTNGRPEGSVTEMPEHASNGQTSELREPAGHIYFGFFFCAIDWLLFLTRLKLCSLIVLLQVDDVCKFRYSS